MVKSYSCSFEEEKKEMHMAGFLHKIFGTTPGEGMQPKEAISYSIAGLGQNLVCGLVGSYLTYYMTNGLLIAPFTVGLIMLFTRLFDALNDPVMGSIVDRTRTKWGKCRPYLLFTPVPIAILTVLLFMPLPAGKTSTVVIITIIYVVWSVVYTIVDVPYWGLATSMTNETHQRGTMLTVARLFCTLGAGIISLAVPILTGAWTGKFYDKSNNLVEGATSLDVAGALSKNFIWLALAIAIISVPTFLIGFKNSKERFFSNEKPKSLGHNIGLIFKNKPLVLIIISGILGSAKMLYMYSGTYIATYNLRHMGVNFLGMEGVALATVITMAVVPGGLIASLLTPWCTKKFGKKNTYIYSHILGAVVMFVMFFAGWETPAGLIVNLIGLVLLGIPQGFSNIITYAMIADSVDYLEWKTGERGEGICFAMQTFINKIGMAVGAAVACFGLGWAGLDAANMEASLTNVGGMNTLFLVSVLIPAISMVLTVIPFFFYKFNEKEQAEAVAAVAERKAAEAEASE